MTSRRTRWVLIYEILQPPQPNIDRRVPPAGFIAKVTRMRTSFNELPTLSGRSCLFLLIFAPSSHLRFVTGRVQGKEVLCPDYAHYDPFVVFFIGVWVGFSIGLVDTFVLCCIVGTDGLEMGKDDNDEIFN